MKIYVDNGERITIVVPGRLASSAMISVVADDGLPVIDVAVQDGMILSIDERSVRRFGGGEIERLAEQLGLKRQPAESDDELRGRIAHRVRVGS